MARKFCLVALAVFVPSSMPLVRITAAIAVLELATIAVIIAQPFR
jgi:hypothetical protein